MSKPEVIVLTPPDPVMLVREDQRHEQEWCLVFHDSTRNHYLVRNGEAIAIAGRMSGQCSVSAPLMTVHCSTWGLAQVFWYFAPPPINPWPKVA